MSDPREVGPAAGLAFIAAAEHLAQISRDREHLEERSHIEIADRLIEAVKDAKPKIKKPAPDGEFADHRARYQEVVTWAIAVWGRPNVEPWLTERMRPLQAAYDDLADQLINLQADLDDLALHAVFPRVVGARNVIARTYTGDFATQGWGASGYAETRAQIGAAVLRARGFTADVVPGASRGSYDVVSDAPEIVRRAIRSWRLDDVRLLDVTQSQNLKVLFGPFYPYTGHWDWPVAARESRESASFGIHRANEDAHKLLNQDLG